MTVETVEKVAKDFLTREEPGVLAIKGSWGVGKTHFWDNLVTELGNARKPTRYCYVSLFGIASKRELSIALYASSQDFAVPTQENITGRTIGNCLRSIIKAVWDGFIRAYKAINESGFAIEIPYIRNLPRAFETFVSHSIKDAVICLDDFERLDEKSFPPEELMGFINELKEKKSCKIVLIFNGDKLENKKATYEKYREKVIDMELLYAPTAQESIAIAVPRDTPCRDILEECAAKLEIANIRVLRKIVSLSKLMHAEAGELHKGVMEQSMRTLVLLAWSYYEREDNKPPIDFIVNFSTLSDIFDKEDKDDLQAKQWKRELEGYGFWSADDLDLSIRGVIERGYLEESGFSESAKMLDSKIQRGLNKQDLETIWSVLNNSFDDNLGEFLKVLCAKFKKYVDFISPRFLNDLVLVLRELDHDSLADKLITDYFTAREADIELFDDMERSFGAGLRVDPILLDRFKAQHSKARSAMSLDEAIIYFMKHNNTWDDARMKPLQEATVEELYNCFKQHRGDDVVDFVRAATRYAELNENELVARNVHSALVLIGKESRINRFRVQLFGITKKQLDESS